jgi:pimeloyl-ACP methyl ester carboxylesterase
MNTPLQSGTAYRIARPAVRPTSEPGGSTLSLLPKSGVHVVAPPRLSGVVTLADGRDLAFAEFGDPGGLPVVWLHGTPGSCRQVAPAASAAASALGVRIIGVARPGAGDSTPARYRNVASIADDIEQLVDRFGVGRFAVVGLSGGGPYTLALGARLTDRVAGLGVLGGVAPTVGEDAPDGGVVALARTYQFALRRVQRPLGSVLSIALRPLIPLASPIADALFGVLPEGDRRVFETPGVKDMFIGDLSLSLTAGEGVRAALLDATLFGRDWGFRLSDVTVPVHWWHGDEDWIVPLAHGEWVASRLPDATFHLRPGDSHLSGYAAADEVIETAASFFD